MFGWRLLCHSKTTSLLLEITSSVKALMHITILTPTAGAIDTVPLGGLVGDNIFLIPERVRKLCGRLRNWVDLRCVDALMCWDGC